MTLQGFQAFKIAHLADIGGKFSCGIQAQQWGQIRIGRNIFDLNIAQLVQVFDKAEIRGFPIAVDDYANQIAAILQKRQILVGSTGNVYTGQVGQFAQYCMVADPVIGQADPLQRAEATHGADIAELIIIQSQAKQMG